MKQVLCFGDSNTWGYNPKDKTRYPWEIRWTGILQDKLSDLEVRIIEEGLCGRTTVYEDALRVGRNGVKLLPILLDAHRPDVVVVMLGTNDCKTFYGVSAGVIAKGLERITTAIHQFDPGIKVLVVSPIHLKSGVGEEGFDPEFNENSVAVSRNLAREYEAVAKKYDLAFLDASTVAVPSDFDREHMDESNHKLLADAIEIKVKELLA